jgi:hypothetical protein
MKPFDLILVFLVGILAAIVAIYHAELWLYFSTLFCLLHSESVGCI